jgi:hypothetical protein
LRARVDAAVRARWARPGREVTLLLFLF